MKIRIINVEHKYTKAKVSFEFQTDTFDPKLAGIIFERYIEKAMYKLGVTDKQYINIY